MLFENKSPSEIVLKPSLNFDRDAKILFGSYFETNKEAVITNTNRGWKFLGILLGLTGNIQGTQKHFDIRTGVIKKCRTIKNLPMPRAVIKSVHNRTKHSARKEHQHKLVFLYRNKDRYNRDNSELNNDAGNTKNNPSTLNDLPDELSGIDMEIDYNDISAVTPEISQSNVEHIQDARNNSFYP